MNRAERRQEQRLSQQEAKSVERIISLGGIAKWNDETLDALLTRYLPKGIAPQTREKVRAAFVRLRDAPPPEDQELPR